jgi:uncharacterized cupredoxin-like copper-binding protein
MPRRPTRPLAVVLALITLLAGACVAPGPPTDRSPASGHGGHAASSGRPARPVRKPGPTWATGAPVRVVMDDRFRYRPEAIMVRAGRRVTFAVTNAGHLPHEFVLGDRATQLAHERQMQTAATGGHAHTHGAGTQPASPSGGLAVPPGETRRLTWAFDEPGIVLYGCHVLGHWAAGMKGTIVVVPADRPPPLPAASPPSR